LAASDGGELLIHQEDHNQNYTNTRQTVFFKSDELLHEVLVTQNTRMSITGWLKCD
jgi:SM-20-related protein